MGATRRRFRFGPFRLDPRTLELERGGVAVALEPLPARLLVRLVERAGDMVSRRELRELGWPRLPDAAEPSLNTCIRQIREALGDDASDPRWIETLRGRGYRFVAPVEVEEEKAASLRLPRRGMGGAWARRAGALASVAAGLTLAWLAVGPAERGAPAGAADGPASVEGRRLLAKAEWLFHRTADPAGALAAVDSLLARAPEWAAAHGLRAEVLLVLGRTAESEAEARLATALEAAEPRGLRALAGVHMLEGDWTGAEASLARAREAHPDDPHTLAAVAYLLTVTGRFAEADAVMESALRIDPLSPALVGDAGLLHLWAGRWDRAAALCRETLALRPEAVWALGCAFDALARAGRLAEAAGIGRKILAWYGEPTDTLGQDGPAAVVDAVRRRRVAAWEGAVAEGADPVGLAVAYAEVGRREAAVEALERAAASPSLAILSVGVDPRLRPLAGLPGYLRVLERLKLDFTPARSEEG